LRVFLLRKSVADAIGRPTQQYRNPPSEGRPMTTRRTVLKVEELGARVLPSATAVIPTAGTSTAVVQTTTTTATTWTGQGRFTITASSTAGAKTYAFQGSTLFNGSTNYSIAGTLTTVGSKGGQVTGRLTISAAAGTLTLSLKGPTQTANAALPKTVTYTVVSGTGAFAHDTGTGSLNVTVTLFPGLTTSGNFTINGAVPKVSTTTPPPTTKPPTTKPPTVITTGPSWMGHGRYTVTRGSNNVRIYTLQGSADFGSSGYFAIGGSIQTVGSKTGQATGKVTLGDKRGTLTLQVTGPTQSANSGLPAKFTYKVLSGTGYFAHYAGTGTIQLTAALWSGYTDKGHFDIAVKPTGK
jgi:hypothetical protein